MASNAGHANLKPIKPGETRNPGGKPVGARNRLTGDFLNKLADDFQTSGKQAIEDCRTKDPAAYIRAIAGLLPKEFKIERPTEGLSDDELTTAIDELRARLSRVEGAGAGEGNPDPAPTAPGVSTLQ